MNKTQKHKRTHQAQYAIYRRRLIAEWSALAAGRHESALIHELMRLAKANMSQHKQIKLVMIFQHNLAGPGCMVKQQYVTTSLGRVFLIPPEPYLPMVASGLFCV